MAKNNNKKQKRKDKQRKSREKGQLKKTYSDQEKKMGKMQLYLVAIISVLGCAFIVFGLNQ